MDGPSKLQSRRPLMLAPLRRGGIWVPSRCGSTCASAVPREWPSVMHANSACVIIGCPHLSGSGRLAAVTRLEPGLFRFMAKSFAWRPAHHCCRFIGHSHAMRLERCWTMAWFDADIDLTFMGGIERAGGTDELIE